jgi:hypothetical protein
VLRSALPGEAPAVEVYRMPVPECGETYGGLFHRVPFGGGAAALSGPAATVEGGPDATEG